MHKTILTTLSLAILITWPAMAQLGDVLADFQSYSVELQNYLKNNLSPTLKPIELQSQNALQEATGELNLPNPVTAGDRLSNVITLNSISDKFENNPAIKSSTTNQELHRLITRSSVASVLSRNGQIRHKIKLQATKESLDNIAQIAQEAGNTQQGLLGDIQQQLGQITNAGIPGLGALLNTGQSDLQLQSIKIQSEQAKIIGETLGQTMQTNHFLQYANLNLANISGQIEENNRSQRVVDAAEAARLLRTTSQVDLLGRKEN
jgi:hypothetical protein